MKIFYLQKQKKKKIGARHGKSDDHLALIMELLGIQQIPSRMMTGKRSKDYFERNGKLKKIHDLNFWSLVDVLKDKYLFSEFVLFSNFFYIVLQQKKSNSYFVFIRKEAKEYGDFLGQMLHFDAAKRCTAAEALAHPWLAGVDCNIPLSPDPRKK